MFAFLCFGDSITYGRGENPSIGWVGRFKSEFESLDYYNAVYNLGIPGDTSVDLLDRIETECKIRIRFLRETDKFCVILAVGINDSRGIGSVAQSQIPLEDYSKNIESILDIIKKYTPHIILMSLTPVDEKKVCPYENTYFSNKVIRTYNSVLKKIAVKNRYIFVDMFAELFKKDYCQLLQDGLHPNSAGYDAMYAYLKKTLEKTNLI